MDQSPAPTQTILLQTIDRFWESVPPVWNLIRTHLRAIAAERFSISVEQFHILRFIRRGYHSVSEIAEAKRISRPAVSQAVDLLVEKGLIARIPSQEDRRCIRLELTQSGTEMLDSIFNENRAWMMERMAALDEQQMLELQAAFKTLRAAFIEPAG